MKLTPFFVLALLLVFEPLFGQKNSFEELLSQVKDADLKEALIAFEKGGAQKPIALPDSFALDSFIAHAQTFLGTPHCMGGTSKKCIDCSGLLWASFQAFDVSTPRSAHEIGRYGRVIASQDSLQRGDLLFFHGTYSTSNLITHAGIYLGEGTFIHTSAKKGVQITTLRHSPYWQQHYLFATRFIW